MKKLITSVVLLFVFLFHSSYRDKKGGDMFQIFWNGKQVLQQFVHISKETKTLQLSTFGEKDQLQVLYSHCGTSGKSREIIFRSEKNEALHAFQFQNHQDPNSRMAISGKAFGKVQPGKMYMYYRSKEIPTEKLLAIIYLSNGALHASR